jgi:hypothetical protein
MGQILSAPYDDIYDSFLAYQKPRVSVQGYGKLAGNTRRVLRWFEGEELVLEEVGIGDAVRYQASLIGLVTREGKQLSAGSVINYLKTARSLFSWLVTNERIRSNPFLELPYPKTGEHLSRNELSEAQMGCSFHTLPASMNLPPFLLAFAGTGCMSLPSSSMPPGSGSPKRQALWKRTSTFPRG